MNSVTNKSVMKTARILNIALNIVIGVLIIGLLIMMVLPFFGEEVLQGLKDQKGEAPSLFALTVGGAIGGSLIAAAYLYVAFVIKKIVRTTLEGNPFVEENISRLRLTWMIIAGVEILKAVASSFIKSSSKTGQAAIEIDLNITAWFLVFVIAIMAEVFRVGLELKRDQELTV